MKPLAKYSDDELIEELARRRNVRESRRPIDHWCDRCGHFKTWSGDGNMPDDYNPCTKKHKMSFRMPEDFTDDEYGFFRRVCADREDSGHAVVDQVEPVASPRPINPKRPRLAVDNNKIIFEE